MQVAEQETEAIRAQIERLAHSELLRNSEAQRRLLAYLAEKSLAGKADELKEYTVGIEAMGKSQDYDPQRDSSVRMQAARLREKIADFYQREGNRDPILIEFPKGRFSLRFRSRAGALGQTGRRVGKPDPFRLRLIAAFAVIVLLATGAWMVAPHLRDRFAAPSAPGALDAIWRPFFDKKRPVLLSLGTPLFLEVPDVGFMRVPGTDDWDVAQGEGRLRSIEHSFPGRKLGPSHVYTGVGEATAAFQLGTFFSARGQDLRLVASETLTWEEISRCNVIFVGPPKFNLQLNDIPAQQDIVLESSGIRNLHPRPNEPAYIPDADAPRPIGSRLTEAHAVITRVPGLHGEGDMLVCASNWTVGTLAAVLYLTGEKTAKDLMDRMRLSSGKLPRSYQVVVKAKIRGYTPIEISYVLHRELNLPR
jgi:hypothetical protein